MKKNEIVQKNWYLNGVEMYFTSLINENNLFFNRLAYRTKLSASTSAEELKTFCFVVVKNTFLVTQIKNF